jgi:hypothetical protein
MPGFQTLSFASPNLALRFNVRASVMTAHAPTTHAAPTR